MRLGVAVADLRGCSGLAKGIGLTRSPWFSAARQVRLEIAIFRVGHGMLARVVSEDVDEWQQLSL